MFASTYDLSNPQSNLQPDRHQPGRQLRQQRLPERGPVLDGEPERHRGGLHQVRCQRRGREQREDHGAYLSSSEGPTVAIVCF